jgi:hypothetical protein
MLSAMPLCYLPIHYLANPLRETSDRWQGTRLALMKTSKTSLRHLPPRKLPCWTEKSDHFFEDRLAKLQAGNAEPLSFEKWRQNIRGSSGIRRINGVTTSASEAFVRSHVGA